MAKAQASNAAQPPPPDSAPRPAGNSGRQKGNLGRGVIPHPARAERLGGSRAEARIVALSQGRHLEVDALDGGRDTLTVRAADGTVQLEVTMTERGPLLRFESADVELSSTGQVMLSCDDFEVRAEKSIVHQTRGDLLQRVDGDAAMRIGGESVTQADRLTLETRRGDVAITANDDVCLEGERIKLNC